MFDGEKVQSLQLTETSEAFSEELEEESEFHSTLYHMFKDFASNKAMDRVERAGSLFIDSVYQLLLATRVLLDAACFPLKLYYQKLSIKLHFKS